MTTQAELKRLEVYAEQYKLNTPEVVLLSSTDYQAALRRIEEIRNEISAQTQEKQRKQSEDEMLRMKSKEALKVIIEEIRTISDKWESKFEKLHPTARARALEISSLLKKVLR